MPDPITPRTAELPLSERLLNQEFDGRYEILSCLGSGGMSSVFRASQLQLGRVVALKVLQPTAFSDRSIERLQREARAITKLDHPSIVKVHVFNQTADRKYYYIAMDYVEGLSLQDLMTQRGKLDQALAIDIVKDAARALIHAHSRGVVHRDLKPSNIMLVPAESGFSPMLVDFGIAKLDGSAADMQRLTQSDGLVGTPYYMSPEQCNGGTIDARADVYSLACVLYETLVGEPVFRADSAFAVMHLHISEPAPPLPAAYPQWLRSIVSRALMKNPGERFDNMSEFLQALEGQETQTQKLPRLPAASSRRGVVHLWPVAIVAIGVAVCLSLLGVLLQSVPQADRREQLFGAIGKTTLEIKKNGKDGQIPPDFKLLPLAKELYFQRGTDRIELFHIGEKNNCKDLELYRQAQQDLVLALGCAVYLQDEGQIRTIEDKIKENIDADSCAIYMMNDLLHVSAYELRQGRPENSERLLAETRHRLSTLPLPALPVDRDKVMETYLVVDSLYEQMGKLSESYETLAEWQRLEKRWEPDSMRHVQAMLMELQDARMHGHPLPTDFNLDETYKIATSAHSDRLARARLLIGIAQEYLCYHEVDKAEIALQEVDALRAYGSLRQKDPMVLTERYRALSLIQLLHCDWKAAAQSACAALQVAQPGGKPLRTDISLDLYSNWQAALVELHDVQAVAVGDKIEKLARQDYAGTAPMWRWLVASRARIGGLYLKLQRAAEIRGLVQPLIDEMSAAHCVDSNTAALYLLMVTCCNETQKPDEALMWLRKAQTYWEKNPDKADDSAITTYQSLGTQAEARGNLDDAFKYRKKALSLVPFSASRGKYRANLEKALQAQVLETQRMIDIKKQSVAGQRQR